MILDFARHGRGFGEWLDFTYDMNIIFIAIHPTIYLWILPAAENKWQTDRQTTDRQQTDRQTDRDSSRNK